jgi:divalent metal cation (Fe/Co/Zn/Cd) transporter
MNVEIQFHPGLTIEEVSQAIERLEATIQGHYPDIHNIFVEAKSLTKRRIR